MRKADKRSEVVSEGELNYYIFLELNPVCDHGLMVLGVDAVFSFLHIGRKKALNSGVFKLYNGVMRFRRIFNNYRGNTGEFLFV